MIGLMWKILVRGFLLVLLAFAAYMFLPNLMMPETASEAMQWPPRVGKPYPDLELIDHRGSVVRLSDFKGKVIIIEPVGMNCPACNAWSGAHDVGGYEGVTPQAGLASFEHSLWEYTGGLTLDDPRLVFVQLLLFDMQLKTPSEEDAEKWAAHFDFDRRDNHYVLAGTEDLLNKASYNMIPGFQLVDKDFVLRVDSTGHTPKDDLYRELIPMVPDLLQSERTLVQNMSVQEAYEAIPHKQTTFYIDRTKIDETEAAYLDRLFTLVDLAVIERVEVINGKREYTRNYVHILDELDALDVPEGLEDVHAAVRESVEMHKLYFDQIFAQGGGQVDFQDPLIQDSSGKLKEAYAKLMLKYPLESQHNKNAFFDHLCALDFV